MMKPARWNPHDRIDVAQWNSLDGHCTMEFARQNLHGGIHTMECARWNLGNRARNGLRTAERCSFIFAVILYLDQ